MKSEADSLRLAESLVDIGNRAGVRTEAVVTTMDAPLGRAVGNAIEVIESIDTLKGRGPADLEELSVLLAARMLVAGGLASDEGEALGRVRAALASGAALELFRRVIERQGGNPRIVDDYSLLPTATTREAVRAERAGYLQKLDAERIGRASLALGAGRDRVEAAIDPGAGIFVRAVPGEWVDRGQTIVELVHNKTANIDAAHLLASEAIEIGDGAPTIRPVVLDRIGAV
jgi:thymidine phosphorylase